jgi:hyperosmotically inducible protein
MYKKILLGSLIGLNVLMAAPGIAASQTGENRLATAVRQQLVTLPYYNVFDWLDGELRADGSIILRGEVVQESTRADAEARVKKIEGIARVVNEIKVLSPAPMDDVYRVALYRAIFNYNSPLFHYSTQVVPPIHIVVDNGRATLKGVVHSASESDLAYIAARQVSGLFDVRNELRIEIQ